ncbi:hypothetical protein J2X07_000490 [Fictibacillus barbaricus]|uniref:Uncharacterized protein n=1 Tax=Fictibacillus barbaricus TaxID=182136 RepID=A0ABU1TWC5_9BACL|nr:hypothetical protein [Fictibacillus barbaricus]
MERLTHFIKQIEVRKKDKIRISHHTIEGDPIYEEVKYNGKIFNYKFDNSEDDFGVKDIRTTSCQTFHVDENDVQMSGYLDQCDDGQRIELFTLHYDSSSEDRFDFALKYGPNLENAIDTNKTPMDNKEKNTVFKNLVYADFLNQKYEQGVCTNSKMKYDLTVWMNGGKRHFNWSDCDKGEDVFTEVAETIIQVYENQ